MCWLKKASFSLVRQMVFLIMAPSARVRPLVFFQFDSGRDKRPCSPVYGRIASIQADDRIIGLGHYRPVVQEKTVGNSAEFFKGLIIIPDYRGAGQVAAGHDQGQEIMGF